MKMKRVYIGFGSNLGLRLRNIETAIRRLRSVPMTVVERISSLYETDPVGGPPQRNHFNGVLEATTKLSPRSLLSALKRIEVDLGRKTVARWRPRVLDLDILTFGQVVSHRPPLILPHPRYHMRRFVLVPFCELAPRLRHPLLRQTNATLLRRLTPHGQRVTMLAKWKKERFTPFKKRNVKKSRSLR